MRRLDVGFKFQPMRLVPIQNPEVFLVIDVLEIPHRIT